MRNGQVTGNPFKFIASADQQAIKKDVNYGSNLNKNIN